MVSRTKETDGEAAPDSAESDVEVGIEVDELSGKKVRVLRKVYEKRHSSSPVLEKVEMLHRSGVEDSEVESVPESVVGDASTAGETAEVVSPVYGTPKYCDSTPSPQSSCRECEDKLARITSLDNLLNELHLEKAKLQGELATCKEKLREVAIQKDTEEIGFEEQLMESKTIVQRQHEQITKLSKNLEKREVEYFSKMEELAESKAMLKDQQRRVEELFDELNSEKRSRGQTEEWLMELRDQCLKLKEMVEERAGLKETIAMLSEAVQEEKRVRSVLQNNYNKLWEINRELESGESVELSATRSQWHRASQKNQQLESQVNTLLRQNKILQQQLAASINTNQGRKASFSEALSGIINTGIDKAPHSHIEVVTSDLSLVNRRIAERMAHGHEVKKLMATLHPDRTPIPACKETLQARFQLLNHIRSVLG